MPKTTKQQEAALMMVYNFIRRLRHIGEGDQDRETHPHVTFMIAGDGWDLTGEIAKMYIETLRVLITRFAVEGPGRVSKSQVQRRFHESTLAALPGGVPPNPSANTDFEKRLQVVVDQLREDLMSEGVAWLGWFPIEGIRLGPVQKRFGQTTFAHSQSRAFRDKVNKIFKVDLANIPPDAIPAMKTDRRRGKQEIWNNFQNVVVAAAPAKAVDVDAAKARMLVEVRLTLDILTFLGALGRPGPHAHVAVRGDAPSRITPWLLFSGDHANWLPRHRMVYFVDLPGLEKVRPPLFVKIDRLLRAERTPFVERLLHSLSMAGRAVVEDRIDQRFLLYMVALESLVKLRASRTAITDRVRTRAAQIVSSQSSERLRVYERLSSLYDIRSGLVHGGISEKLNEIEVRDLQEITCQAIFRMLSASPFKSMTTEQELEDWFLRETFRGRAGY